MVPLSFAASAVVVPEFACVTLPLKQRSHSISSPPTTYSFDCSVVASASASCSVSFSFDASWLLLDVVARAAPALLPPPAVWLCVPDWPVVLSLPAVAVLSAWLPW